MGVDANLFLSHKWEVRNIQDILKNHLGITEQKIEFHTWSPDYMTISFDFKTEARTLHVHTRSDLGGFKGILLSLRAWGNAVEILTAIANVTGGFLVPQDCEEECLIINEAEQGNLKFLVDHALIENDRREEIKQAREILKLKNKK